MPAEIISMLKIQQQALSHMGLTQQDPHSEDLTFSPRQ